MSASADRTARLRLVGGGDTVLIPPTAMNSDLDLAQRLSDDVRRDLRDRQEAIVQRRESAESNEALLRARVHGSTAEGSQRTASRHRSWVARLLRSRGTRSS